MVSFVGCSSSTNNETNENKEKIETKSKKVNKYKIIDEFISNYEKKYNTSIADVQKMNIQGEDYRVEFRLNAFKNAIGKKGTLNGYKIEIVNYGVWSRDSLRIYLTADMYLEISLWNSRRTTFMACLVRTVQARAPCSTSSADCSASNKVPFSWMAFRHKIAKPRC